MGEKGGVRKIKAHPLNLPGAAPQIKPRNVGHAHPRSCQVLEHTHPTQSWENLNWQNLNSLWNNK